jgi:hypothetical protein
VSAGEALAGLDEVAWAERKGQAIPGLLRGVVAGDPDALGDLQQEVVAGGVIWEASSYAVPFLARLAVAGVDTLEMLGLLGSIAASRDEQGVAEPGRARREFAAHASVIEGLRDHDDPKIRATLAWALAQHSGTLPALLEWWEEGEADPAVRCALLRAVLQLDPAVAASLAVAAEGDPGPGELLMAAWACAAGGEPWTPLLQDAATAWAAGGLSLPAGWWHSDANRHDPFAGLLRTLAMRGDAAIAATVAADALARATAAGQQAALQDVVRAVRRLTRSYPASRDVLAAALGLTASSAAADPAARDSAE